MEPTTVLLVALPERCYRCDQVTRGIVGVLVPAAGGRYVFREFDDVAYGLAEVLAPDRLREVSIGPIKHRRSRQRGSYLSNGCVHCDAILGSFPLREGYQEFLFEGGRVRDLVVPVAVGDGDSGAQQGTHRGSARVAGA